MKLVVTGNIGCGKSTVVKFLRQYLPDHQLFDFDQMVAELYQDDVVKMQLTDTFGTADKKVISDLVHASAWQMDRLQAILNGSILANTQIAFKKPQIILDVPLYFERVESAIHPQADLITLCVCATENDQIERVKTRNGWSEEKIRSVIAKQWPQEEKAARADYCITNFGSLDKLQSKVDDFIQILNRFEK